MTLMAAARGRRRSRGHPTQQGSGRTPQHHGRRWAPSTRPGRPLVEESTDAVNRAGSSGRRRDRARRRRTCRRRRRRLRRSRSRRRGRGCPKSGMPRPLQVKTGARPARSRPSMSARRSSSAVAASRTWNCTVAPTSTSAPTAMRRPRGRRRARCGRGSRPGRRSPVLVDHETEVKPALISATSRSSGSSSPSRSAARTRSRRPARRPRCVRPGSPRRAGRWFPERRSPSCSSSTAGRSRSSTRWPRPAAR